MEKHIKLAGILNIVYSSLVYALGVALFLFAALFGRIAGFILRVSLSNHGQIPETVMDIVPIILYIIAVIVLVFSIAGITGGIGVLYKKEWGRITVIVISFFNLTHIPVGTALGAYSIWTLVNEESVKYFKSKDNT